MIRHAPDRVTNVVVSNKVIQRLITGECFRDQRIDFVFCPISQEHRTSLRAQHEDVSCAIVFLVTARALMLANNVMVVFLD